MSKATEIGWSLVDLILRKNPRLPRSKWEPNFHEPHSISESPNKQSASNACELVWQLNRGSNCDWSVVHAILDWFTWLATQPFMPKESTTPEGAYRTLTAYPTMVAAGVANDLREFAARDAAEMLARAHFAWCLLGLAPKPGRKVLDHHLGDVDEPCVLVGQGPPQFADTRYIVQPGKRGWVRSRTPGKPKTFLFTNHEDCSIIVYQGLTWDIERKLRINCEFPTAIFAAIRHRWPTVLPWCLGVSHFNVAKAFAENPTSRAAVSGILPMLKAPSLPTKFIRFVDGAVMGLLERGDSSSTDTLMLDAAYAAGEIRQTSADDGLRIPAIRQDGWEEDAAIGCRAQDGTGPTMRLPKPPGVAEAWTVIARDGRTWLEGADPGVPTVSLPGTPPDADLPPPADRRSGHWWEFWR